MAGSETAGAERMGSRRRRRRGPWLRVGSRWHTVYEYALLIVGSFVIAAGFNLFLRPNEIASGGVSGISIIAASRFGIEPALTQWALNIPLFIAGFLLLGGKFGAKTAVGTVVLPLFVLLTSTWEPPTTNPLLAAIYGGIAVGLGLGTVFRGRGSTGGLDLAAQIIHRYIGVSLGLAVALLDGMVILGAGFAFSPEKAMYALIGLFVTSKTIDIVQVGFFYSKVAFIISSQPDKVAEVVLYDLDRGLTKLNGVGGYTGQEKTVLMVVVGQTEVSRLKALVRSIDPEAFVIFSPTSEVFGEGFTVQR